MLRTSCQLTLSALLLIRLADSCLAATDEYSQSVRSRNTANQKTKALSHKLSAFLLVEMIGIEVRASHLVTAYAVGIIADSSRRLVPCGNRRIFAVGSIP